MRPIAQGKTLKTTIDILGNIDPSLAKSITGVINLLGGMNSAVMKTTLALGGIGLAVGGVVWAGKKIAEEIGRDIKAAASWEKAMTGVVKVTDGLRDSTGAYTEQYYTVERSLRDLATKYPIEDITTIADAAAAALQDGTIELNNVVQATEDVIKVSKALDISMEDAGHALSFFRLNFGYTEEQAYDLADAINYLGQNSGRTPAEINEIVTSLSGVAGVANLDAKALAAMGATIAGLQDSRAATALKNLMLTLQAGPGQSKAKQNVFKQLGIDAEEFSKYLYTDAVGALSYFMEQFNEKIAPENRLSAMKDLFGMRSTEGLAILLNDAGWENFQKYLDMIQSGEYMGSTDKEVANISQTYEGQLQELKGAIEDFRITAGQELLPTLTPMIGKLKDFMVEHGDQLAKLIADLGGMVINESAINALEGLISIAGTALPIIDFHLSIVSNVLKVIFEWTYRIATVASYFVGIYDKLTSGAGLFSLFGKSEKPAGTGGWNTSDIKNFASDVVVSADTMNAAWDSTKTHVDTATTAAGFYQNAIDNATGAVGNLNTGIYNVGNTTDTLTGQLGNANTAATNLGATSLSGGALDSSIDHISSKLSGLASVANNIKTAMKNAVSAASNAGPQNISLPKKARGGFAATPSIFGEAGLEAAISFDPAYRRQNVQYWTKAGEMLGVLDREGRSILSDSRSVTVVVENNQTITVTNGTKQNVISALRELEPDFIDAVISAIKRAQEGDFSGGYSPVY